RHKALRERLRSSYDKVLDEPVPERLLTAARGHVAPQSRESTDYRAVVVPLRPKRAKPPSLPYWGAIAAGFVVGALLWHFGGELYSSGPVVERNGQLLASGVLDEALSNQLVRDQRGQSPVQIGVSFRSKGGNYCRTFQLRENNNLSGLACRDQDTWRLEALAQGATSA